jgi:hypothetical protein
MSSTKIISRSPRTLNEEKQPSTCQKARRLAWHSRRRETHRQDLRHVDRGGREMGAKCDGPGIAWGYLERENSKVVLTSDMAEKWRSVESLFHCHIFWMLAHYAPALNAVKPAALSPNSTSIS